MSMRTTCPSCDSAGMSVFYKVENVPAHDVLLMPTREVALSCPRGDIGLGFCPSCGFISNVLFDPSLHEYSPGYEATQAFSPTFSAFAQRLASDLVTRYDLNGKDIIEIGCGNGEFLTLLCELGGNRGIGFDPAYVEGRVDSKAKEPVTFIKDYFSEEYAHYQGDFVCCRMTLEHIPDTADFVHMVRRSIGDCPDTIVFFQVPDVVRILRELAFWDIYYEHCSYFSLGSLGRLFRRCGFDVVDLRKAYGDQYLMIEARPGIGETAPPLAQEDDLEQLAGYVKHCSENHKRKLNTWKHYLQEIQRTGRRAVLWGGGSKAVAFLTTLNLQDEIECVVDINPHKQGTYLAGAGQDIVAPDFLRQYEPDVVIVMNPIYREEIEHDLHQMGLAPELITV